MAAHLALIDRYTKARLSRFLLSEADSSICHQSERLNIYKEHAQTLLDKGLAYRCFCKPEDLEKQKLAQHAAGQSPVYTGTCRSVNDEQSVQRANSGEAHVIRFRGDAFGNLGFKDAIYGPFQKKENEEDFIIIKTDGFPTYHFANVVDDHLMQITHVIRGEVRRDVLCSGHASY